MIISFSLEINCGSKIILCTSFCLISLSLKQGQPESWKNHSFDGVDLL